MSVSSFIRIEGWGPVSSTLTRDFFLFVTGEYQCFEVWKLAVPSFIGIEEVQMGVHVLKLNKGFPFARKPLNINVSRSASSKLALVTSSHYNCDIKEPYVSLYHVPLGLKGFRWGQCPQT